MSQAPDLSIFESIAGLVQQPGGMAGAAALVLWILLNINATSLVESWSKFKKRKESLIENYLNHEKTADKSVASVFIEIRNYNYFAAVTVINAEKKLRDAIIDFHNKSSYRATWKEIKNSMSYISLNENGHLFVRNMNLMEMLAFYYNMIVAATMASFSLAIFMLLFFSDGLSAVFKPVVASNFRLCRPF